MTVPYRGPRIVVGLVLMVAAFFTHATAGPLEAQLSPLTLVLGVTGVLVWLYSSFFG